MTPLEDRPGVEWGGVALVVVLFVILLWWTASLYVFGTVGEASIEHPPVVPSAPSTTSSR